jgi:uncharacterized protein
MRLIALQSAGVQLLCFLARLPQRVLIGIVQLYRWTLKPWLGQACRFEPTCSAYALQALREHGAAGGSYLATRRLLRCHPWCQGGHDPVPATLPRLLPQISTKSRP